MDLNDLDLLLKIKKGARKGPFFYELTPNPLSVSQRGDQKGEFIL